MFIYTTLFQGEYILRAKALQKILVIADFIQFSTLKQLKQVSIITHMVVFNCHKHRKEIVVYAFDSHT